MTDLRSDTVTKPTHGMLDAMFRAPVGDDVFSEDPSVNKLEAMTASLFGMESALFCPSGTMTNQIGIKVHTQPGQEVICENSSHIFLYEGAGIAFNSGCQARTIIGERGKILPEQVEANINNKEDLYKPLTALVSLENTTNRGGGCCYTITEIKAVKEVCIKHQLPLHLDGARLFNALVANGEHPKQYGALADSISICLSKGLGIPAGSVLLGTEQFIKKARRIRKVMGGGMRQAGYFAAAGIYALENHVDRLAEDHLHAKKIAEALLKKSFIGKMFRVETNILIFEVKGEYTAASFCALLQKHNVLCFAISSTQVRMVTHLDITPKMVLNLTQLIHQL